MTAVRTNCHRTPTRTATSGMLTTGTSMTTNGLHLFMKTLIPEIRQKRPPAMKMIPAGTTVGTSMTGTAVTGTAATWTLVTGTAAIGTDAAV